jgi:hypothetical protein
VDEADDEGVSEVVVEGERAEERKERAGGGAGATGSRAKWKVDGAEEERWECWGWG